MSSWDGAPNGGRSRIAPRSGSRRTPATWLQTVTTMVSHPQYLTLLPRDKGEVVLRVDADLRVRQWDEPAEALLGYSTEEVLGRPYADVLSDRQRAEGRIDLFLREVAQSNVPRHLHIEHRTKAGLPLLLSGVASAIRRTDGMLDGWLLVMYQALRDRCLDCALLHYLEAVTSGSADAIIILDEEERIRSWNRGAEDIYGFKAEDMLGKPVEVLFPPDRRAAGEVEYLRRVVEERGFIRNYETTRVTSDGRPVQVELTRSAIRDSHGRLIGSSAIVRDITNRKRLEERLLHTERLAVVGRMAAQVAHELRNPLSSISLNAELLADELNGLPEEQAQEARSLLASITKEIERLAAVSEEYLQFARLPELAPAPTDVTLLVEDLAEFTELELAKAGITVKVETEDVPNIPVDRRQLRQALLNLIRNALEAMGEKGGTLTLAARVTEDGEAAEIAVVDTGPGIPEGKEEQIFEPFFSTKEGGTGLGLSLARRVAHEHGGELFHRPTAGGGATFAMRLPVRGIEAHGKLAG